MLYFPVNTYPLFENAIRGELGRSVAAHQLEIGKLFSEFTKVAADNPHAWFPTYRSPEEIATESEKNRYVGYPYTKYMNSIIRVDQAAAVVMTSVAKARELGIPEDRWVYLHGCADANDLWYVTERVNYHSSPAIRTMGRKAFAMAGMTAADMDYLDLYSCFPSAVEIGAKELGFALDDPRGFTVTGGLPYFGGAGNNYVMHSIATMMDRLRANPGSKGLCTANGWFVTKHSMGIYSTQPREGTWEREDPASYQAELDAMDHPVVDEAPSGAGKVETYTVVHGRGGPEFAIVIGRLGETGHRFVAHTPADEATLQGNDGPRYAGRARQGYAGYRGRGRQGGHQHLRAGRLAIPPRNRRVPCRALSESLQPARSRSPQRGCLPRAISATSPRSARRPGARKRPPPGKRCWPTRCRWT